MNRKGRDVRSKHCAAFGTRIRSVHTYYRHFQMSSSTQWTKMNVSTIWQNRSSPKYYKYASLSHTGVTHRESQKSWKSVISLRTFKKTLPSLGDLLKFKKHRTFVFPLLSYLKVFLFSIKSWKSRRRLSSLIFLVLPVEYENILCT